MKTTKQNGTSAIELAILLSATMILMPAVALLAMVFFQYSVLKEATRDAAMYMATIPHAAMRDEAERGRAVAVAQRIVNDAAVEAGMTGLTTVEPALVLCENRQCTKVYPKSVDVTGVFTIEDTYFSHWTDVLTDGESRMFQVTARSTIPLTRK